jgi:hypothetical protein
MGLLTVQTQRRIHRDILRQYQFREGTCLKVNTMLEENQRIPHTSWRRACSTARLYYRAHLKMPPITPKTAQRLQRRPSTISPRLESGRRLGMMSLYLPFQISAQSYRRCSLLNVLGVRQSTTECSALPSPNINIPTAVPAKVRLVKVLL